MACLVKKSDNSVEFMRIIYEDNDVTIATLHPDNIILNFVKCDTGNVDEINVIKIVGSPSNFSTSSTEECSNAGLENTAECRDSAINISSAISIGSLAEDTLGLQESSNVCSKVQSSSTCQLTEEQFELAEPQTSFYDEDQGYSHSNHGTSRNPSPSRNLKARKKTIAKQPTRRRASTRKTKSAVELAQHIEKLIKTSSLKTIQSNINVEISKAEETIESIIDAHVNQASISDVPKNTAAKTAESRKRKESVKESPAETIEIIIDAHVSQASISDVPKKIAAKTAESRKRKESVKESPEEIIEHIIDAHVSQAIISEVPRKTTAKKAASKKRKESAKEPPEETIEIIIDAHGSQAIISDVPRKTAAKKAESKKRKESVKESPEEIIENIIDANGSQAIISDVPRKTAAKKAESKKRKESVKQPPEEFIENIIDAHGSQAIISDVPRKTAAKKAESKKRKESVKEPPEDIIENIIDAHVSQTIISEVPKKTAAKKADSKKRKESVKEPPEETFQNTIDVKVIQSGVWDAPKETAPKKTLTKKRKESVKESPEEETIQNTIDDQINQASVYDVPEKMPAKKTVIKKRKELVKESHEETIQSNIEVHDSVSIDCNINKETSMKKSQTKICKELVKESIDMMVQSKSCVDIIPESICNIPTKTAVKKVAMGKRATGTGITKRKRAKVRRPILQGRGQTSTESDSSNRVRLVTKPRRRIQKKRDKMFQVVVNPESKWEVGILQCDGSQYEIRRRSGESQNSPSSESTRIHMITATMEKTKIIRKKQTKDQSQLPCDEEAVEESGLMQADSMPRISAKSSYMSRCKPVELECPDDGNISPVKVTLKATSSVFTQDNVCTDPELETEDDQCGDRAFGRLYKRRMSKGRAEDYMAESSLTQSSMETPYQKVCSRASLRSVASKTEKPLSGTPSKCSASKSEFIHADLEDCTELKDKTEENWKKMPFMSSVSSADKLWSGTPSKCSAGKPEFIHTDVEDYPEVKDKTEQNWNVSSMSPVSSADKLWSDMATKSKSSDSKVENFIHDNADDFMVVEKGEEEVKDAEQDEPVVESSIDHEFRQPSTSSITTTSKVVPEKVDYIHGDEEDYDGTECETEEIWPGTPTRDTEFIHSDEEDYTEEINETEEKKQEADEDDNKSVTPSVCSIVNTSFLSVLESTTGQEYSSAVSPTISTCFSDNAKSVTTDHCPFYDAFHDDVRAEQVKLLMDNLKNTSFLVNSISDTEMPATHNRNTLTATWGNSIHRPKWDETVDLCLICGNQEFYVHRLVVVHYSRKLCRLLCNHILKPGLAVEVIGISPTALHNVIDWMYTMEINIDKANVLDVFMAAVCLDVKKLQVQCINTMHDIVNESRNKLPDNQNRQQQLTEGPCKRYFELNDGIEEHANRPGVHQEGSVGTGITGNSASTSSTKWTLGESRSTSTWTPKQSLVQIAFQADNGQEVNSAPLGKHCLVEKRVLRTKRQQKSPLSNSAWSYEDETALEDDFQGEGDSDEEYETSSEVSYTMSDGSGRSVSIQELSDHFSPSASRKAPVGYGFDNSIFTFEQQQQPALPKPTCKKVTVHTDRIQFTCDKRHQTEVVTIETANTTKITNFNNDNGINQINAINQGNGINQGFQTNKSPICEMLVGAEDGAQSFDIDVIAPVQINRPARLMQTYTLALPKVFNSDRVLLFGGLSRPDIKDFDEAAHTVHCYDVTSGKYERLGKLPTPLFDAAACCYENGIYLTGGISQNSVTQKCPGKATTDVWYLDLLNPMWQKCSAMRQPRAGHSLVQLDDKIYAIGGAEDSEGSRVTSTVEAYSPKDDTWTNVSCLPAPLWRMGAACFNGAIWLCGGLTEPIQVKSNEIFIYYPERDRWFKHRSRLLKKVAMASLVTAQGELIMVGGLSGNREDDTMEGCALDALDMYDDKKKEWNTVANMAEPRFIPSVVSLGDQIIIIGGRNSRFSPPLNSVEIYGKKGKGWIHHVKDLPLPLSNSAAVGLPNFSRQIL